MVAPKTSYPQGIVHEGSGAGVASNNQDEKQSIGCTAESRTVILDESESRRGGTVGLRAKD